MVKKHIVKKRIQKRKQVKKDVKKDNKKDEKKDVSKMNRLEYEMSMMDPRFRAAMMGFNNPAGNAQLQQVNQALHEKEQKNNEARQLLETQQKLADAKQEQLRLKDQAKQEKFENQMKLQALQDKVAEKDRMYKEAQERHKQEQEMMKNDHQLQMILLKDTHERALRPIQDKINSLATKYDIQKMEADNNEQLAKKTAELTKAEMKKQLQDQLLPIQKETAEIKRQNELAQQKHNDDIDMMNASYNNFMEAMKQEHQKIINPIKEQTAELRALNEVEQQRHEETKQLKDSVKEVMIAEFKSKIEPSITAVKERSEELKRKSDLLDAQYKGLKELKDSEQELIRETIKSEIQPQIQENNKQTQILQNMINNQTLINNQQLELIKSKSGLDETQIKAMTAPIIQKMELQKTQLENMLKKNGDVSGLLQKIENLKTDIEVLKRQTDPELIKAHGEEMREITVNKLVPLEQTKRLAQKTNEANRYYENEYNDAVKEVSQALVGEEFDVSEIGKPELNDRIIKRNVEIQKERATLAKQRELYETNIRLRHSVEEERVKTEETKARLDAVGKHSKEYNAIIVKTAKQKEKMEREGEQYRTIYEQINELSQANGVQFEQGMKATIDYYDAHPHLRKLAEDEFGIKRDSSKLFTQFPAVVGKAIETSNKNIESIKKTAHTIDEDIEDKIDDLKRVLVSKGFKDIQDFRYQLDNEIEMKNQTIAEGQATINNLQDRESQYQRLIKFVDNRITEDGGSLQDVLNQQDDNELTEAYTEAMNSV